MNTTKKNVVIVGFSEAEKRSVATPIMPEPYDNSQKIRYVESLKEASKYQGFMLIIDNSDDRPIVELDKKYRKLFNKFEMVIIYNESYTELHKYSKWNNISLVGRDLFYETLFYDVWDEYKEKKDNEVKLLNKFNKDKNERLKQLYNYIDNYKNRKTSDIAKYLNIDERTIQRYMIDLNNIHHNIGYDYFSNEWYFIW